MIEQETEGERERESEREREREPIPGLKRTWLDEFATHSELHFVAAKLSTCIDVVPRAGILDEFGC